MHVERRVALNTFDALFAVFVKLFFMTKKPIYRDTRRFFALFLLFVCAINDSLFTALSAIKFASLTVNRLISYSFVCE